MSRVERLIAADADRVWGLVSDVERWDRMLPTFREVTRLGGDGGPTDVGARFAVVQPGLPKAVYEVTEWRPGSAFTWVSSAPGVRTTARHELRTEDGQTRLGLGISWTGPLAGVVRLLVGAKARRMVELEADTFARLATSDGGASAGADRV
jgi:carbon monoxide dehydrogenase subunit G